MAKRLIGSANAKLIRKEILQYRIDRNTSAAYSKTFNFESDMSARQIAEFLFSEVRIEQSLDCVKLIKDDICCVK